MAWIQLFVEGILMASFGQKAKTQDYQKKYVQNQGKCLYYEVWKLTGIKSSRSQCSLTKFLKLMFSQYNSEFTNRMRLEQNSLWFVEFAMRY